MNHGEVWADGDGAKFLVISADRVNALGWPGVRPVVVPIVRERFGADERPWLVTTCEADPVSGSVVVVAPMPMPPLPTRVGMAAGVTMAGVQDGLRALFDL